MKSGHSIQPFMNLKTEISPPRIYQKSSNSFVIDRSRSKRMESEFEEPFEKFNYKVLNLVEDFHLKFQKNDLTEANDFFKQFDRSGLLKSFRELSLQKEVFVTMMENIDRFITYGTKYIEKLNSETTSPCNYASDNNNQEKLISINKQKLKNYLSNGYR